MQNKTITLLGLFILATAVVVMSKARMPHDFNDSECIICHVEPAISAKGKGKEKGIKSSLTDRCLTCHTDLYEKGYMHPVDLKPNKVNIPRDFPLSKQGLLTCNTCHDVHAPYETPFGTKSHFLRRLEQGKAFCDACHQNSLELATGHQAVFRKAHAVSKFTETDPNNDIDEMSRNCISCHDGSFASSVKVNAGVWKHSGNFFENDNGGMHPIGGHSYDEARHKNPKAALKPLGRVNKKIRFFNNGKLGCGSCHDPFSTNPKKLTITNERSQLCFSCHDMDRRNN